MKRSCLTFIGLMTIQLGFSQVFVVESKQPSALKADAGEDKSVTVGASVQIGGNPSAMNGYADYVYLWSPSTGLNDPTIPNPLASPNGKSVYTLTVTDGKNCIAVDEVEVPVSFVEPTGERELLSATGQGSVHYFLSE